MFLWSLQGAERSPWAGLLLSIQILKLWHCLVMPPYPFAACSKCKTASSHSMQTPHRQQTKVMQTSRVGGAQCVSISANLPPFWA